MKDKSKYTQGDVRVSARAEPHAVVKAKPSLRTMLSTTAAKRILAAILCFAVSLFVAGAEAFPGTYPFGIAVVSAVTGAASLIPVLAGALLGSARIPTVGGAHALILTLLSVVRIFTSVWLLSDRLPEWMKTRDRRRKMWRKLDALAGVNNGRSPNNNGSQPGDVFRRAMFLAGNADGTMLRENISVRMALSACAALFAGAWSVVRGGFTYYDLFGAVFALLFTPLLTYLIYASADRNMRTSPFREAGIYAVCALLTHSLQTFVHTDRIAGIVNTPFGFGILFAFAATIVIANQYGIHRGALAGVCCGMMIDLRYLPLFALAAVIGSVLGKYSHTFGILSAGVAAVAWATYQAGFDGIVEVMPPVTVACAVLIPLYRYGFIRLPENLFGGAVRGVSAETGMALRQADEMGRRISQMSDSLASVSAILYGMSERLSKPGKPEMREICESAFGMYCRGCAIRSKCHEARASKTAPVINAMTNELTRDGVVSAATVPSSLASHCFNIGRIIDEINLTAGSRIARMKSNDKLAVTAADLGLAGELMKTAYDEGESVSRIDGDLSKKLRRLLTYQDFQAGSVTVYGGRVKHILVRDVDLASTRLGGDDIRKLFEKIAGIRLSQPEFTLDGAVLSMTMHSVYSFACLSGRATCAASSVHRYWGDPRSCGADCAGDGTFANGYGGIYAEGDERDEAAFCRERYAHQTEEIHNYAGSGEDMETGGEPYEGYEEYEMEGEFGWDNGKEPAAGHAADETAELQNHGGRIRIDVTDAPPLSEDGEVCGDVITSFESAGKFYMLISDGMGSGREAALTSGVCATLLQRLIESGAGLETSLKMLNNIIRAGERECSATVDIAEIDLITGEAKFVKSGAAPSFVLRGGSIFRLQSKTVPIGIIRALDAEMIKFDVMPGDRVVMVSDGAARSYDEVPWLLDMMTSDEVILKGSPKEAAAKIVREAARRGAADDITAGVICVVSE